MTTNEPIFAPQASPPTARRNERVEGWCILRTNGRRTLRLAASLNAAGIEAWTPRTVQRRRLSRRHMGFRDVEEAIVPTFVFVRACHLQDLLRVLSLPTNPHPAFSIFQHAGRAPVIADRDVGPLRCIEDDQRAAREAEQERLSRAARRALRRDVAIGATVTMRHGAFAGMSGVVEETSSGDATILFNGTFRVAVASWLLIDADVSEPDIESPTGSAAGVSAPKSRRSGHRAKA